MPARYAAAMPQPSDPSAPRAFKGRGAASNPEGRFESIRHHAEDDGWQSALLDEDNRREFKHTLTDLATLSRTLAARSASIDSGLNNAARTLDNAARFSADLPRLVARIEKSADDFDRMTRELARDGASINTSVAGARADLRQATRETLPEVRLLASELREVTGSLHRFSEELEQNPSMLLYGKPLAKPGPGE